MKLKSQGKTLFIILLVFITHSVAAFVSQGDIWRKRNEANKEFQYIYCLSDVHDSQGSQLFAARDITCRNTFLNMVDKIDKKNALFIIEDPFSYVGNHVGFKQYLDLVLAAKSDIFLSLLASTSSNKGCNVVNVESRRLRIASISCLAGIHNILAGLIPQLQGLTSAQKEQAINTIKNLLNNFTAKDIFDEYAHLADEIKSFNDGTILTDYYQETLTQIEKEGKTVLRKLKDSKKDMATFCTELFPSLSKRTAFYDGFLLWALELVDMKALHSIYNASDKKKIFLIMGFQHIQAISPVLEQLGYEKVKTVGAAIFTQQESDTFAACRQKVTNINVLFDKKVPFETYTDAALQLKMLSQSYFAATVVPDSLWQLCLADDPVGRLAA